MKAAFKDAKECKIQEQDFCRDLLNELLDDADVVNDTAVRIEAAHRELDHELEGHLFLTNDDSFLKSEEVYDAPQE